MTELMKVGGTENATMTTIELLNVINGYRAESNLKNLANNKFIDKVEDELDDLGGWQNIPTEGGGTPMKYYDLSLDQCLLIGMRELLK